MIQFFMTFVSNAKGRLSFGLASLLYWIVMLASYPLVSGITSRSFGNEAWKAGLVAFAVCSVAGWIALWVSAKRTPDTAGLNRIMMGMLITLFVPMMGMIVIGEKLEELKSGAVQGQLMIFFLIMLTTETLLTLQVKPTQVASSSTGTIKEVARHGG